MQVSIDAGIVLGGEVNWLIDGICGERVPAVDLHRATEFNLRQGQGQNPPPRQPLAWQLSPAADMS
jgi:hypothetical protein